MRMRVVQTVGKHVNPSLRVLPRLPITAALLGLMMTLPASAAAEELAKIERFQEKIEPLLEEYCYGCHAYGAAEGNVAFDAFESPEAMFADREHWWKVLKNVRADVMPPQGEWRPGAEEKQKLFEWIKTDVFGVDPQNPDPGRVTVRRLNRIEYQNTIRDLLGVEFQAEVEFPPDDSGHGFDNIGDVLSVSPLLIEKYLDAADTIISGIVPTEPWVLPVESVEGVQFTTPDSDMTGRRISFYDAATVAHETEIEQPGHYRVVLDAEIDGSFDFDPGRCRVTFKIDGQPQFTRELAWHAKKPVPHESDHQWEPGKHKLEFVLEPLVAADQQQNELHFDVNAVRIEGPLDERYRVRPENYERFFPEGGPPEERAARSDYAREVLRRFATRAFRRPVDEGTLERLVALVQAMQQQEKTFEAGIARAMTAVLASPQFLFRLEGVAPGTEDQRFPQIDEYSLASRLSYFLWSTMPDDQLFELAGRGELRKNLRAQVQRMLADQRSDQLIVHFVGQWLQARDIEVVSIDALAAAGLREEYDQLVEEFRRIRDESEGWSYRDDPQYQKLRERIVELRQIRDTFDGDLRNAMRRETEMVFEHIVREDRSVLELIDSDYAFLNQRLAEHYGLEGIDPIEGDELRRVALPPESVRGGILTQGTILAVTSNPTRTSPVKRGLFVLENILGTPTPPPPAAVPELEAAKSGFEGEEPSLRELLELHRADALCSSCHARFDPLGLGLENLDPLGRWRDLDAGKPIDASGQLITGEEFGDIKELKRILRTSRRMDFYRCLAERLLTYALGRGLEYYDEVTVDQIAAQLDAENGRFSSLLFGIIESAPMQRQRR